MMDLTFLGTGNARGIPAFGCQCDICERAKTQPEYERHCPTQLVKAGDEAFVLDAGRFDLHRLIEQEPVNSVVLSHFHPDHVYGLFMMSWGRDREITVFAPPDKSGYADLIEDPGILKFEFVAPFQPFQLGNFAITPFPLIHGILTFGYAIQYEDSRLAYLMDTCGLPEETKEFLTDWRPDVSIIDCNQTPDNPKATHNTPAQAIEIHDAIGARRSYLSHLSCSVSMWLGTAALPESVIAARDGMIAPIR
ncbi:MAG: MBL fold metallo-hydrolase [Verrucomicrobiota bacterium]